jgi:hypothetical protein
MMMPSQIPCTVLRSDKTMGVWAWLNVFIMEAKPMTAGTISH